MTQGDRQPSQGGFRLFRIRLGPLACFSRHGPSQNGPSGGPPFWEGARPFDPQHLCRERSPPQRPCREWSPPQCLYWEWSPPQRLCREWLPPQRLYWERSPPQRLYQRWRTLMRPYRRRLMPTRLYQRSGPRQSILLLEPRSRLRRVNQTFPHPRDLQIRGLAYRPPSQRIFGMQRKVPAGPFLWRPRTPPLFKLMRFRLPGCH